MKVEIIAELAQGFEGSPEQARLLLKAAASAGANAAKFQLIYADELATPDYKYYGLFKSLEMPEKVWADLAEYAANLNIGLQVDIFGGNSLNTAEKISAAAVKIHGTDIANVNLLNMVANSSVSRVLLGAGGAHLSELLRALEILSEKDVVLLLGFQGYPTQIDANQVARIRLLSERITKINSKVLIGFADHAIAESPLSYALAAVAIGAGASVIEKHLTLGRVMKLEDHESALNPDEFLEFTQIIRSSAEAFGVASYCEEFGMSQSECEYRKMIRRHVVANRDLEAGLVVSHSDLTLKRTSSEEVLTNLLFAYNKTIKYGVQKNKPLSPADIF